MIFLTDHTHHTSLTTVTWRVTWCIIITVATVTITDACFIRNCPLGGKRSSSSSFGGSSNWANKRQCMQCGPQGLGQCIGPNICCGQDIGCFMSTAETSICAREDENPIPCEISGKVCGTHSDGRCAADGICCTDEKCTLDAVCDNHHHHTSRDYTGTSDVKDLLSTKEALSEFAYHDEDDDSPRLSSSLTPKLEAYIRRLLRIKDLHKRK